MGPPRYRGNSFGDRHAGTALRMHCQRAAGEEYNRRNTRLAWSSRTAGSERPIRTQRAVRAERPIWAFRTERIAGTERTSRIVRIVRVFVQRQVGSAKDEG